MDKAFKKERDADDQINSHFLICFGLLHCGGSYEQKAEQLYQLIQPKGESAHTWVSANDKELHPIFEKLCKLATINIFDFAAQFGQIDNIYSGQTEVLAPVREDLREDVFLDEIFGSESMMSQSKWLKAVTNTSNWVFDSKTLRQKVFESAKLPYEEI